jgi:hypothetical protein
MEEANELFKVARNKKVKAIAFRNMVVPLDNVREVSYRIEGVRKTTGCEIQCCSF